MLLPLFLLCVDFMAFAVMSQWLVYGALVYLMSIIIMPAKKISKALFLPVLAMVMLQDFAIHGRVGLILMFIVPMILVTLALKDVLLRARWALMVIWVVCFFLFDDFFITLILFSSPIDPSVTIIKILVNLIIGYAILWGKRGNRSLVM